MNATQVLFSTIGLPLLAIGLRDMTHLVAARTVSPVLADLSFLVRLNRLVYVLPRSAESRAPAPGVGKRVTNEGI